VSRSIRRRRLLGHSVKVNGSMSASLDANRDLLITADYKFVYAVVRRTERASTARSRIGTTRSDQQARTVRGDRGQIWINEYN